MGLRTEAYAVAYDEGAEMSRDDAVGLAVSLGERIEEGARVAAVSD